MDLEGLDKMYTFYIYLQVDDELFYVGRYWAALLLKGFRPVTHDHEIKCFFFHMLEGPFSTLPV